MALFGESLGFARLLPESLDDHHAIERLLHHRRYFRQSALAFTADPA